MNLSWPRRLAPLIASQIFLWLTLALFAFGPWQWPLRNPAQLYLFVCGAHLALVLGYLSAAHKAPAEHKRHFDPNTLVRWSLWITLIALPFTSFARTGSWIPDLIGGLKDPGAAYTKAQIFTENSANFAAYLRILAAPVLVMLFPLGFYFGARLNWPTKILMFVAMLVVIIMSIATGQRRDMADLIVTVPFVVVAAHFAKVSVLSRRAILVVSVGAAASLLVFTGYFTYSHVSRVGQQAAAYGVNPVTRQSPDTDNAILNAFPSDMQPGVVALLNYLTTGYYGLGLALERPVQPMYGAGHSMFLTRQAERLTNTAGFESRSLAVQISDKDGFKYPVFWCTAYPYFANDLGFIGTILMLFFVGRGLAQTWIDMLGGKSPFAVVFFCLLMTLVFYLPATNRMLQDGEGVVAFYSWLLLWSGTRLVRRKTPALVCA
jgi:uncharacterized membrane protein YciS (DUF1049 family)